jgi:hypothetical protein
MQKSLISNNLNGKDRRTSAFAELFSRPNFENYFSRAGSWKNRAALDDGTGECARIVAIN